MAINFPNGPTNGDPFTDGNGVDWLFDNTSGSAVWHRKGTGITIVNDLTTGGTTDALSAEQGKVLDIAKIDSIPDIVGSDKVSNIVSLTQAEYDLGPTDPTTIYFIV